MTTYKFNLSLSEQEAAVVQEALELLMAKCESEIESGSEAPYYGFLCFAKEVRSRLRRNAVMASTNSGHLPKDTG